MSAAPMSGLVLVADDDPNDLFLLQRRFTKAGLDNPVRCFRDGEELLAFLRPIAAGDDAIPRPSVIFLDVKMPRMDGFAVLRWLRRQRALKDVPVVMLSGSAESRDIRRATALGAVHYLIKHPPPEEFARVIAACCGPG